MNRQANYIISAFLLLLFAGFYFLIPNSLFNSSDKNRKLYFIPQSSAPVNFTPDAAKGKTLFMSKCASCHQVLKNGTGPALAGFDDRGPWIERKNLYEWIKNPSAFIAKNEYAAKLKKAYGGIVMTAFPDITNEEIDAICEYINGIQKAPSVPITER